MSFNFGGQTYVSPTVASSVNDTAELVTALPNGQGLLLIGQSTNGQPNTPLTFTSPTALQAALGSGDLVDAGLRAFNPSPDVNGPSQITVIRVNPATQSTLAILNTSAAALGTFNSVAYGLPANQVAVGIEPGSIEGYALTAINGAATLFEDNVYQAALLVTYSGAQVTATVAVSATALTLQAGSLTPVVIPFSTYQTVSALAQVIDTIAGFSAVVQAGSANLPSTGLDVMTATSALNTGATVTATLQAIAAWFASTGVVTLTLTGSGLPAALATTYLSGGTAGVVTNTNWSNALTVAQSVNVQWMVALTTMATIHAMVAAHVAYMSTQGRSERRGFASSALGTTDSQAISAAAVLQTDRMAFVHLGIYDYDLTGVLSGLVLYSPYIHAAMVAGGFAGAGPGVAMTNKALNVQGMERNLQNPTNTDPLINGGVLCSAPDGSQFKVVESVSTWLSNNKLNRVQISCGAAVDYTVRSVRAAVKPYIGDNNDPDTGSNILTAATTALELLSTPAPNGPGVLVGDTNSPAYTGLQIAMTADDAVISFQCSPVVPLNYEGVSVYVQPYSGTITATSAT